MDARAGMDFEEIQQNACKGEIQKGFMYWWEQIELIVCEKNHYDTYGVKYKIQENYLIAECFGEQIYKWEIVKKDVNFFKRCLIFIRNRINIDYI